MSYRTHWCGVSFAENVPEVQHFRTSCRQCPTRHAYDNWRSSYNINTLGPLRLYTLFRALLYNTLYSSRPPLHTPPKHCLLPSRSDHSRKDDRCSLFLAAASIGQYGDKAHHGFFIVSYFTLDITFEINDYVV
jgi:hypothetical protein